MGSIAPGSSDAQDAFAVLFQKTDDALAFLVPAGVGWQCQYVSRLASELLHLSVGSCLSPQAAMGHPLKDVVPPPGSPPERFEGPRMVAVGGDEIRISVQPCATGLLLKVEMPGPVPSVDVLRRLHVSLHSLYDGLWDWPNAAADPIWWSDALYRQLGYAPGSLRITASWMLQQIHPDDRDRLQAEAAAHMANKGMWQTSYRLRCASGDYRWFQVRALALINPNGTTRITSVMTDIHDQRQAEQELRFTKERLELALLSSEDLVWDFYDLPNRSLWLPDRFASLLELPEYTATPTTFDELCRFIHPDDLVVARGAVECLDVGDDISTAEFRLRHGNGWRWFVARGKGIKDADGVVRRALGTLRDVHDTKLRLLDTAQTAERLEQRVLQRSQELEEVNSALREALKREATSTRELSLNERRLRMLADASSSIIWSADKTGRFSEPQVSWQAYTGQPEKDAAGLGWHRMIHEDDVEFFRAEWQECLREVKPYNGECRVWCQEQRRYRYFAIRALPLVRGEANVLEWVGSMTDVQAQKEHEKQLRAYARELQVRNEYLQEFAYAASHDLREPLRKIQAYSNLIQDEYAASLPDDGSTYLVNVQRAAARMEKLIDDLLQYSRASTASFEPEQVDLQQVLRDVCEVLEFAIHESAAQVRIHELPSVPGQPTLLHQLFQNLISNALKYHQPSVAPKIEVAARTEVEPPEPGGSPRAWHVIVVRDNGIGFDPKHADRIFRPFRRLHTRVEYEGTGIGLAICRRIVERHRGRIEAFGRPGEGASFTIHLPAF